MIESLYLILGCAIVWYILVWSIRNDKVRSLEEQIGLIKMRRHISEEDNKSHGERDSSHNSNRRR